MNIETKFSPGDAVFYADITRESSQTPCTGCSGTGRLAIIGRPMTVACPDCCGRGYFLTWNNTSCIRKLTIGQIRILIAESRGTTDAQGNVLYKDGNGFSNYSPISKREEQYMCVETGIGSGIVYSVEDLFEIESDAWERAVVKLIEHQKYLGEEAHREEERRLSLAREYESTEEDRK